MNSSPVQNLHPTVSVVAFINSVEQQLKDRLIALEIKPGSAKALKMECEFLAGAMAAANAFFPNVDDKKITEYGTPRWIFSMMTGRTVTSIEPLQE